MPAPPTEIRIKRKATDDPVELLHVQNEYNGLRQIKQYIFKRQRTSNIPSQSIPKVLDPHLVYTSQPAISSTEIPPSIKASRPPKTPSPHNQQAISAAVMETPTDESTGYGTNGQPSITLNNEPRRFHLSRNSVHTAAGFTSNHLSGVKAPPTVFIEQRRIPEMQRRVLSASIPYQSYEAPQNTLDYQHIHKDGKEQSPRKSRSPAPLRNSQLSSGKIVPWDADTATLAAQMQAYTMQEIGNNLMSSSAKEFSSKSKTVTGAKQVSSFNPKGPALKYRERYHEELVIPNEKKAPSQDELMTDAANPDREEPGYIMDTYIRMPAEMFELEKQKSVGVLVLESQPDIDDFYNDDSDSDSDIDNEDDDENAENHPSTDYPEEEDASDDGYKRNPYQNYHDRNTSDSDEYDEEHTRHSDDEVKPPWARRPWLINSAYRDSKELEYDDED